MARSLTENATFPEVQVRSAPRSADPAYQAFQTLRIAFVIVPILTGIDKFLNLLTNWDMYLAPAISRLWAVRAYGLTQVAGVLEIIAGLIVLMKPRVGAYLIAIWLFAIIVNLFLMRGFYDIALRDFG